MSKVDRRTGANPEDLAEFGDGELAGDPSIAALIALLPESERESYRALQRGRLASLCTSRGLPAMTWRQYFESGR